MGTGRVRKVPWEVRRMSKYNSHGDMDPVPDVDPGTLTYGQRLSWDP